MSVDIPRCAVDVVGGRSAPTVVVGSWVAMCREEDVPAVRAALARDGHVDVPVLGSPYVPVPAGGGVLVNTALLDEALRASFIEGAST